MRPVLLLAVAAAFALTGCSPEEVPFQAQGLVTSAGPGGINLNDEIGIRFNQELDPGSVSLESLRVTDELGSRIPIRARATNDTLFLAPAEPEGWPSGARLAIEIPHPWLGRPIRSVTGAPNGAPFRAEIASGTRYSSRGGMLRLTYHSVPFSGGTDVTQDAEFVFEFDAPMDIESVRDAITLEDLTREETIPGVRANLVSSRRLSVAPFFGGDFRPGSRYRLTLPASVRAQDTRVLGAPLSFVFTTTRSRSGQLTTTFGRSQLVDPSLKPDKGPLVPQLEAAIAWPVGTVEAHERAEPFGHEPSRVQILIPASVLVPVPVPTPVNKLIGAMSFKVFGAEPALLRLSARLDYAAPAHGEQLSRSFEDNWSLPSSRPRDLIGAEGDVQLLTPEDGVLTLRFARPFLYEPLVPEGRPLVLEIVNESGILNDSAGLGIRGENGDRSQGARFLASRGDFGEGERQQFVPALRLSVQEGFRPVALQPWPPTNVEDPEYFRRADDVVATPGFVNFQVEYRAFEPGMDPASNEHWKADLSGLAGHRTIQARIVFPLRSPSPVSKDAGILRLTVPYRERGE